MKIFPAFLILHFGRAALLDRGDGRDRLDDRPVGRATRHLRRWLHRSRKTFWPLGNSGWPIRGNNQSLIAGLDRLTLGPVWTPVTAAGVREAGAPRAVTSRRACTSAGGTFVVTIAKTPQRSSSIPCGWRWPQSSPFSSPIAWDHYWTMMLSRCFSSVRRGAGTPAGSAVRYAFWSALSGVATGLSPVTSAVEGVPVLGEQVWRDRHRS